jgi:heat-inducible transcriptional repressor
LLRALISQYIRDGEPVGSRTLARHSGLDVSPATIRNVLADLEELGLVHAPHTSSGRVPTVQGYRIFVDSLLELRPLESSEEQQIRRELPASAPTQNLIQNVSNVLSGITHFVGLVTVPRREQFAFRHIDFVALDEQRVLAILVFADSEVQNRVLVFPQAPTSSELEWIANYLNANYAGLALDDMRRRVVSELSQARDDMNRVMATAIHVAEAALAVDSSEDVVLTGQTNLMGRQGLGDVDCLRDLFEAFARKRELLQVLDACVHADGVRLFIGEESGVAPLGQCSVVAAPYGAGGKVLGVLGVIGPTRMHYERVIPVVQATARILSGTLNQAVPAP